jgi:galactonate dehydratase
VATLLGATARDVTLYANINRGLTGRTPAAFAAGARAAVDAGFTAIKIAPFDEVDVFGRWGPVMPATRPALDAGLARVAATRAAVGGDVRLMVDCHWRFDEKWAESMIDAVTAECLHWIECPLPEDAAWLPALKRLRTHAQCASRAAKTASAARRSCPFSSTVRTTC